MLPQIRRAVYFWMCLGLLFGVAGWPVMAAVPKVVVAAPAARVAIVPPGFSDTLVASVPAPTALGFTPDGRMLISARAGQLRIYQNNTLLATPALTLTVCANRERGFLGVAVDPNFASNNYIYVFYTYNKFNQCPDGEPSNPSNPVNRVSRFTLPASNIISPATELVLVDNMLSLAGNHNGGDVQFGADGKLYISVGDSGTGGSYARLTSSLNGKILRVNTDGTYPTDNPYASASGVRRCGDPAGVPPGTGPCGEVFAFGLRNPWRIAFRPNSNQFYINDVGEATWEEIDDGVSGADYGWNVREGPCPRAMPNCTPGGASGYTDPIYYYNHNIGCSSITGGAFVPAGVWPAAYDNTYLFGDIVCGKIFQLLPSGNTYTATEFATNLGFNVVSMVFGPYSTTQALYYAAFTSNGVRRISYAGGQNQTPTAVASAQPTFGAAPLLVNLSAWGSSDPNAGDTLTFDWQFGDGVVLTNTSAVTVTHTYTATGVYTATLVARDNHGATSAPATVRIDVGNSPPTPNIVTPTVSTLFWAGQVLTLTGSASDAQDGTLPNSALTWEAVLHHIDEVNPGNAHTHPFLPPTTGNNVTLTAPLPEDFGATALSYLEVRLTATDSLGLATTITRAVQPRRVTVQLATLPSGLGLWANTQYFTTPRTLTSWTAYAFPLGALPQTDGAGRFWTFGRWADSQTLTQTRLITTTTTPMTFTAWFVPQNAVYGPLVGK